MRDVDGLKLSERLGLLRAVCEQYDRFQAGPVFDQTLPLDLAIKRYGGDGVPRASDVVFTRWGDQPIIAGMLTEPSRTAALPFVRCATVAQQTLGEKAVDLILILFGPEGSSNEADWARAAADIEDDDRICRKLVWLLDGDATSSAEVFLRRSPFARPWRGAATMTGDARAFDSLISDLDIELDELALKANALGKSARAFLEDALTIGEVE